MRTAAVLGLLTCLCMLTVRAEPAPESLSSEADKSAQNGESLDLETKKDELLGLLAQVDERYGDVAASLKTIESQIAGINQSLIKLRKEAATYQNEVNRLSNELSGQIKAAYAMGQQERLKLMLNQQDPALSSRMMIYYEYVNKARLAKLGNLQQTLKYLDQLEKNKQAQTEELTTILAQKKTQQTALDEVRKQRSELVSKLHDGASSQQTQLSFLKQNEIKLINLIKTLENDTSPTEETNASEEITQSEAADANPNSDSFPRLTGDFSSLKGRLPMPVSGKLSSLLDNTAKTDAAWKGVLINAKEGAEIRAVAGGKIVYAGILKGYGLLTIIEHNENFMSLYAFNQSLLKHKGDNVEPGDVIATVGQSGGREKPGLYFEIRRDGKPVDPLLWCRN